MNVDSHGVVVLRSNAVIDADEQAHSPTHEHTLQSDSSANPAFVAAERWVSQYGDVLWRFALSRTRSKEIAEEIVQETLLAAMKAFGRFAGESSEQTWLLGIAAHKIADHVRQMQRRTRQESLHEREVIGDKSTSSETPFGPTGKWTIPPKQWGNTVESAAESAEMLAALRRCLDELPPQVAEAVWLRDLLGVPAADVCKALSLTATNLWTRMHRARSALRVCVEQTMGMTSANRTKDGAK